MHVRYSFPIKGFVIVALALCLLGLALTPLDTPIALAAVGSDFNQCRNGVPADSTFGQCNWVGGNLNSTQATYNEGMGAFQRLLFTNIASGTSHKIDIQYQFSNQNQLRGYDFLISWAQASTIHKIQTGVTPTLNECNDLNPAGTVICNQLTGSNEYVANLAYPNDPYTSSIGLGTVASRATAFESMYGTRTYRFLSDCPLSATPTYSISHLSADSADSDVLLTINYTTRAPTVGESYPHCLSGGVSDNVMLEFAGHLALSGTSSLAWGLGKGAAGISGSGWHIRNIEFDDKGGSLDNQIQIAGFDPTAADLVYFKGHTALRGVRLKWQTGSEVTTMGFNVWRRDTSGWHKLNAALIPAKNLGGLEGALYKYLDRTAVPGTAYRYHLEIREASGKSAWSSIVKIE